ncbi:MAG: response regulator transcription factor [Lachnospiraceae bacterium]|nr:response regulator transcription factor [Lachnospiraceae bacterium]
MRILLVEDNETIIQGLRFFFEKNGYELVVKTRIRQAVEYMDTMPEVDLIILDVTLPDGNGFDLFRNEIRDREIPTIFLTARDDEESVVKGLTIGAEDYITKPFSTKELLARMNKILMRTRRSTTVTVSDITFDMDKMVVTRSGQKVDLSALELKILSLLFLSLNKVVTRNTILDKIWEWTGNDVDDHTVTVYMKRIREKLQTDIIITVKGIGYRIDDGA